MKIDYSDPLAFNRKDKVNVTLSTIVTSIIFIGLTFYVISQMKHEPIEPEAIKSAQILNIVNSNMRSRFREPLIYDLEFIVPALKEHGYSMSDYYVANRYFKKHGEHIILSNGYYYALRGKAK